MNTCLFLSDLHGKMSRYEALFKIISKEKPDFVFLGGDLLPHQSIQQTDLSGGIKFIHEFLIRKFSSLKSKMDCNYPEVFLIPGNDDHRSVFSAIAEGEDMDLWRNIHSQCVVLGKYRFYGYACVPPTPFMIKDWERFDVTEEKSPYCIAPSDGYHSTKTDHDQLNDTIQDEISRLVSNDNLEFGIFLFHSPPYNTFLDQAEIGTGEVLPAGSRAISNLIAEKQPYITMHGHIHESTRLTGEWKQAFDRTISFSAAHDGPELAVVRFDLHRPHMATRMLVNV